MARNDDRRPGGGSARQASQQRRGQAAEQEQAGTDLVLSYARKVVRPEGAGLALRPGQDFFDTWQVAALVQLGVDGATPGDLTVYLHVCNRTGLDPFAKQIYMIKRRQYDRDAGGYVIRWTIQTGIDGYRVIRDRAAARDGVTVEYEDTIWYDKDGKAHDVWLQKEPPAAARVVVLKDGRRFPGVVRYDDYVATTQQGDPQGQWKTQPSHMLEKCAESFALRRAFPQDLAGIHTTEEMAHVDREEAPDGPAPAPASQRLAPPRPATISGKVDDGDPGPADPWAGQPATGAAAAGEAAAGEPAGQGDGDGDDGQQAGLRKMLAIFRGLGYGSDDTRDDRMAIIAVLARENPGDPAVDVPSSAALSHDQRGRVIQKLQEFAGQYASGDELRAALAQIAHGGRVMLAEARGEDPAATVTAAGSDSGGEDAGESVTADGEAEAGDDGDR